VAPGKPIADKSFGFSGYPTITIVDQNGVGQHLKIDGLLQPTADIEYEMKVLLKNN
jgi:hypothetical protein